MMLMAGAAPVLHPASMNVNDTRDVSPLRAARLRAGMSMEQVAVKAGIGRATLYWAEVAPHRMSERTATAVAEALGIPLEQLQP
jgi:transcriptional regulator with XRE-family HTH domain